MRALSTILFSSAIVFGCSGMVMADAFVTNKDSVDRTVYVECEGEDGVEYSLVPTQTLVLKGEDLNAGESGCIIRTGSNGINLYDGNEFSISKGAFLRQK